MDNEMDKLIPEDFRLRPNSGYPTVYEKDTVVAITDPYSDNYGSVGVVTSRSERDNLVVVKTAYDTIMIRPENITPVDMPSNEALNRLESVKVSKRLRKIANRLFKGKETKSEEELVQLGFEPSRKNISENTVKDYVEMFGNESDEGLVEAAKRNEGMVYSVGGDIPVGTAPYLFRWNGKKFEDNVVK